MKKLYVGDVVSRAWDLAVKHWPVFLILSIISGVVSSLTGGDTTALSSLGQHPDPKEVFEALSQSFNPILTTIAVLLSLYIGLVTYRMLVSAYKTNRPYEEGKLLDAFKVDIVKLGLFLGVEIVLGIILVAGYICCIIPGIFLTIRFLFTPLIAATEDVTFTEAFGRSWDITKGHFWELLLLGLTAIGIAIVGVWACCIGVFFADIIVNFMLVLAYFELAGRTDEGYVQTEDF